MNPQLYMNNPYQNMTSQMNIIFKSNKEGIHSMVFYYGTTINQVLIEYLKKIGRPDLINKSNKIIFIFNGKRINFDDQTKIENYFHNINSPLITADYVNMINKSKTFDPKNNLINMDTSNSSNPSLNFHNNLDINEYQKEINDLKKQLEEKDDEIDEIKKQLKEEQKRLETNKKKYWDLWQKNEFLQIDNDQLRQNQKNLKSTISPGEKLLVVYFNKAEKISEEKYKYSCKNTELFVRLEERFYKDFPQFKEYDLSFLVNNKRIKRFKTIDENQIKNNDIINIFIIKY